MHSSKRNINIDIIKVVSLLLVIGVHFFLYTRYYSINYSITNSIFIVLRNIFMAFVPLFIIVTKVLNLSHNNKE